MAGDQSIRIYNLPLVYNNQLRAYCRDGLWE